MHLISFYMFLAIEKLLMLLPKNLRRAFFEFLANVAHKLDKKHNKIVEKNLEFVFGNKLSKEKIEDIKRYSYKTLALNFLYTMESRYYNPDDILKDVTFENLDIVKKVQKQNRPIIFVTAHYGCWELAGRALSYDVEPILIIYKKMKNKYFQNYMLSSREKWKMSYAERHGATRAMMKRMKQKKAMAILIDTNINAKEGIKVDFLGKKVSQIKTTAYFARKYNAALIPALLHTKDDKNYIIKFYDEIIPPKTDDEEKDILISTQMQTTWLSNEILKEPKPWFWLHRRFKSDYPEIYENL